jgi:hypothetical protein
VLEIYSENNKGLNNKVIMSKSIQEVTQNACHRLQYKLQHGVSKKAELESECLCFDEFPERRFERTAKPQPEKLPGDLQKIGYWFVVGFLLQLKCQIFSLALIHFETPKIAKMLHNVYKVWQVSFEETFHRRFAVLVLNVHGLHHRSKPYRFFPSW